MKILALLLALFATISCSTTTPPRAIIVAPPAKQEAVAPLAIKVKEQVDTVDRTVADVRVNSKVAVEKAKSLKDKGTATPVELTDMWELLTSQDTRITQLVDESFKAKASADKLPTVAIAKDTEASLLRQGNETLTKKAALDDKYIGAVTKKIEKQAGDAQIGKWLRWAIIGGAVLGVVAIILLILTKLGIIAAKVAT